MKMIYESKKVTSSVAAAHAHNSTGISRPAVRPVQMVTKPGAVFSGKATVSNEEMRVYLKSGDVKALREKVDRLFKDPWLRGNPVLTDADTVRKMFGSLFEKCEDQNTITVNTFDAIIDTNATAIGKVETFVVDEKARTEAYAKAAFKGSPTQLGEIMAKMGEDKTPEDVMRELVTEQPMTFKWIKTDIIATHDYRIFVKDDPAGDRAAGSAAIMKLVAEHGLNKVVGPKKVPFKVGSGQVVVVEGVALETVDDMALTGWKEGIGKDTLAQIGFVILHAGVGDVNSLNARKVKGSDTFAIIDTGGSFAKGNAESRMKQIQINYGEFLASLSEEYRRLVKTWEQFGGKLPAKPADVLVG